MEIQDIKNLPVENYLQALGYAPVRKSANELLYHAPYREDRRPSFRVNVAKGLWFDFGLSKGGDIFDLAGEIIGSSDFMTQSVQFSKDIKQKQKMVEELGLQQTEHIEQMVKDCEVIQKRAEEQMKRLNNQVKNMLANQEKHIALFREDMRSEVRAVVTSRKRESSKRIVQQLVTLLDEL